MGLKGLREDLASGCELIWVQLSLHKKDILVGVHYRPPASPPGLFDELEGSIARIPTTVPVVLCGDFNAASINYNWDTCTPLVSGQVQSRLCDV